jgi:hypothetical protein
MTDEQKKQLIQAVLTAVITLLLAVVSIFGYNVVVNANQPQAQDFGALGLGPAQPAQRFKSLTVDNGLTVGGATIQTPGATRVAATPQPTATTFPFVIRGGTASTYTSGAAITHGFAAAPTWCIVFPNQSVTSTLTLGTTTFSSDMASTSSPIYWQCGKAP